MINEKMAARIKTLPIAQQELVRKAVQRIGNAEREMDLAQQHLRELIHRLGVNK